MNEGTGYLGEFVIGLVTVMVISFIVLCIIAFFQQPKWINKKQGIIKIYHPFVFSKIEEGLYKIEEVKKVVDYRKE